MCHLSLTKIPLQYPFIMRSNFYGINNINYQTWVYRGVNMTTHIFVQQPLESASNSQLTHNATIELTEVGGYHGNTYLYRASNNKYSVAFLYHTDFTYKSNNITSKTSSQKGKWNCLIKIHSKFISISIQATINKKKG